MKMPNPYKPKYHHCKECGQNLNRRVISRKKDCCILTATKIYGLGIVWKIIKLESILAKIFKEIYADAFNYAMYDSIIFGNYTKPK